MPSARRFLVEGRVQGVFFRESTRRVAEQLGLTGHAINLPDGTVEVVASGDADALAALERYLHDGPTMAAVTNVIVEDIDVIEVRRFTTG